MTEPVLDLRHAAPGRPRPRRNHKLAIVIALALVVLIGLTVFTYLYLKTRPASGPDAELKRVEAKVGRHYLLPTDETPALATVTDKSQVSALFLKNAQDGDKILVYQRNHLAIVYRPSIDRIIAVGPVTYDVPAH